MIDLPARGSELSAPGTDQEHNIDPACCLQSRTNYWKDMDKYWQILAILTILTLPVACNQEQFTNIGEYRQIFFMQPKYWYVSNEIIVAISHWKSWTLTPFNYQRISAWKYSPSFSWRYLPWIFTWEYSPEISTSICSWIFTGHYLSGLYLLRVDLLHPRILQTDALLMHRCAEKKKLLIFTFLHSQRPLRKKPTCFSFQLLILLCCKV